MGKKIERKKLVPIQSAQIEPLQPKKGLKLEVEGQEYVLDELGNIFDAETVVAEVAIYLRGRRRSRNIFNILHRYLKFAANCQGAALGGQILKDYRTHLDRNLDSKVNTKYELFHFARDFTSHLIRRKVLPSERLPKNFKPQKKAPKDTFAIYVSQYCSGDVIEVPCCSADGTVQHRILDEGGLADIRDEPDLDSGEAGSIIYCLKAMSTIHQLALEEIGFWEEDFKLVEGAIAGLSEEYKSRLRNIESIHELGDAKSVEGSVRLLYAQFGRLLPRSQEWPDGVVDFLKRMDWSVTRLQSALFPTPTVLQSFLMAMLSHEKIMPNVDSAIIYPTLNIVMPSSNVGCYRVFLPKYRGSSLEIDDLSEDDRLGGALKRHVGRMEELLKDVPTGNDWLRKENCPLFLQYNIRTEMPKIIDVSMTSYMVQRALKKYAKSQWCLLPLVGNVTGENFRPTWAYVMHMLGVSQGQIKRVLGHAKLSTTRGYTNRVETSGKVHRKAFEFQRHLISEAEKSQEQSETDTEKTDDAIALECDAQRIYMRTPVIVAEWLAWIEAIEQSAPRLKNDNPERWVGYWLPMLTKYKTLVRKLNAVQVNEVKKLASDIELGYLE